MMEKASALLLLIFGAAMAATSLFMPPEGEIDGSVLMLFGQILVYAGSIFGVKIYIEDLVRQIKRRDEIPKRKTLGRRTKRTKRTRHFVTHG